MKNKHDKINAIRVAFKLHYRTYIPYMYTYTHVVMLDLDTPISYAHLDSLHFQFPARTCTPTCAVATPTSQYSPYLFST
jgi:hypothetical protein